MTSITIAAPRSKAPLYWLALGAFAIGTEGFMIAPLLQDIAADLSVSLLTAGQLITAFALTYALSSPILTALTGSFDRRQLLIAAMAVFAIGNIFAWAAPDYWALMGARVLLAVAAGLYVPNATALAGALLEPERRGTALAMVTGGTAIAVALGVPLGSIIGDQLGWRLTFAGVGVLAAIATLGLLTGLARDIGRGLPVATLRERVAAFHQPGVPLAFLVTTLWATGAYTVYSYLALFLTTVIGLQSVAISGVLFLWGAAAAIGIFSGGALNDRFGSRAVITVTLSLLFLAFLSLSLSAAVLSPASALVPVLAAVAIWGLTAWAFLPAQQARLIGIAGIKVAPVVISLNASFMYLGFSLGAVLGSFVLSQAPVSHLGWVGGVCESVALAIALWITRRVRASALVAAPGE